MEGTEKENYFETLLVASVTVTTSLLLRSVTTKLVGGKFGQDCYEKVVRGTFLQLIDCYLPEKNLVTTF